MSPTSAGHVCIQLSKVCLPGFAQLLESLEKPGMYFSSLNPGNSLEFCVKTLESPSNLSKTQKNRST